MLFAVLPYILKDKDTYFGEHNPTEIQLQVWTCPEGSRWLKLPQILQNQHLKVIKLSAARSGRLNAFLFPPL